MRRRMFVLYLNLGDAGRGPEVAVNVAIDDSGSMSGEPIAKVREALRTVILESPEGTRLGLMAFGSEVRVLAEPTEHREFLLDQVDRFQAQSGTTMLYDAIGEACTRFDPDSRHRYVLVLTDGGDTGSPRFGLKGSGGKTSLVTHAVGHGVRIYCVGFGAVHRDKLERLSAATGGRYFDAGHVGSVIDALREAMREILAERGEVRLRPEFTRLAEGSFPAGRPWLRQISIDPWPEPEVWTDATHLRFPAGTASATRGYRGLWEGLRASLVQLLEEVARGQSSEGPFPHDIDIVVAGWLDDPVFRAMSPGVLEVFGDVRRRLEASLPGALFPVLLPLVHEAGTFDDELAAECYAWLSAIHNHGGTAAPKAVLVRGDSNQHRYLNQHGYSGLVRDGVLHGAANALHALALAPPLVTELVGYHRQGAWSIRSIGAATLDSGLGRACEGETLLALERAVQTFCTQDVPESGPGDGARRRFRDANLGLEAVKAILLAPIESGAPEGVLAGVRVDHSMFWPPRPDADLADYLAVLPQFIEERGAEYLYRKLEALRRSMSARSRQLIESVAQGISWDVDRLLFGSDDGCIRAAHAYLARLAALVEDEAHRIEEDRIGTDLEAAELFGADEEAVRTFGNLDRASARRALEDRIRNRPVLEALAVRHGLLAVTGGVAAHGLAPLVLPAALSLGPLGLPVLAGFATGAVVAVVGAVRWRLTQQRLETAIREYVGALVRGARVAAVRECMNGLRKFYDRLLGWIGKGEDLPPLDLDEGRDETRLSERQRVAALRERLAESVALLMKRRRENPVPENPFVWEIGTEIRNPLGEPPRLSLRPAGPASELALQWTEVAPSSQSGRWREACRRRRCDDLHSYLGFHEERIELPRRLWTNARGAAMAAQTSRRRIANLLSPESLPEVGTAFAALDVVSFPPLRLTDTVAAARVEKTWLAETGEFDRLAGRHGGQTTAPILARPQSNIEPTWQLHRVAWVDAPIEEAREWSAFRRAWAAVDEAKRREALAVWGDPAAWQDPATGDHFFARTAAEEAPARDGEAEGLL